jgi:hypothetical protein
MTHEESKSHNQSSISSPALVLVALSHHTIHLGFRPSVAVVTATGTASTYHHHSASPPPSTHWSKTLLAPAALHGPTLLSLFSGGSIIIIRWTFSLLSPQNNTAIIKTIAKTIPTATTP